MPLPPETLAFLREQGRLRARRVRSQAWQRRSELAALGIIDVGPLSDDDVTQALGVYRAGLNEPVEDRR